MNPGRKYIWTSNGQIKALKTFTLYDEREITAGTLGGTIDSPRNLSQTGACWIFPGSSVTDNAYVSGNAIVQGNSEISEDARVYGNSVITDGIVKRQARVLGDAMVQKGSTATVRPIIEDNAVVSGSAKIIGAASASPSAEPTRISGNVRVQGEAIIRNGGKVIDDAKVQGKPVIEGTVKEKGSVSGCSYVDPTSIVQCNARLSGCAKLINTTLDCNAIVYGDLELENETVTDAGYVTTCPEKGTAECCEDNNVLP